MTGERTITVMVNGAAATAPEGTTVAALLLDAQRFGFREAVASPARGPLCGIGVCYECRVTIDGVPHRRACMTAVREGMPRRRRDRRDRRDRR